MKACIKTLALLLSLSVLGLSLCGCAREAGAVPTEPVPTETPPLQSYYGADISAIDSDESALSARVCTEDGFYSVDYGYHAQDGDVPGICFVSYAGEKTLLEKFSPVLPPEELSSNSNFYSSYELEGLSVDGEGNLVTVERLYMSWYSGPGPRLDEYGAVYDDYESRIYARVLDKTGRELSSAQLAIGEDENLYASDLVMASDDSLVLSGGDSLVFFSKAGEQLGRVRLGGYVRSVLDSGDGEILAVCYDDDGGERVWAVSSNDFSAEELYSVDGGLMHLCPGAGEYELYYSRGQDFYGYSPQKGECFLFNWLGLGLDVNCLSSVEVLDDGSVRAIGSSYLSQGDIYANELALISLRQSSSAPVEISLGCFEVDNRLGDAIKSFNRSGGEYRLVPHEYYKSFDFGSAEQIKLLQSRLLGGNMPDILVLDGMNHRLFASGGLLADLYPYLDSGDGPQREDFFPNVLKSCELGGRLYAVADTFSIDTVLADASLAGEEPGWDYEQYYGALAAMGEGCDPFEVHTTSQELLQSLLMMEMDSYINWETLEADFAKDSFIGILEFTASFPYSFDWDNYQWSDADIVDYRIKGGRQMLLRSSVLGMEDISYNDMYFNGSAVCKGYPTHDGSVGNTLVLHRLCAISESSPHKEGAWCFMKSMLQSETGGSYWGFPSLISLYEPMLEKYSQPNYAEAAAPEGEADAETVLTELPQGHVGTATGVRSYYSLSPDKKEQLDSFLKGCEKLICEDDELISLVIESVSPYYLGQMDGDTACAAAQRAAQEYLSQYK